MLLLAAGASAQPAAADAPVVEAEPGLKAPAAEPVKVPAAEPAKVPAPAPAPAPVSAGVAAEAGEKKKKNENVHFKGLDLGVTLSDATGLYFHRESYYNVLSLQFDPSFALGRQLAGKDSWWAELSVAARLPIDFEISSSEPAFRGTTFPSRVVTSNPESIPIAEAMAPSMGAEDGALRRPVRVNDLFLELAHGKLLMVPVLGIDLSASLRTVIPTSILSRNQGLVTAPSLGLGLQRSFGPLDVSYSLRFTKYFFTRTSPAIVGTLNTVLVNGREEPTWRPDSTGVTNPDYGFIQGLSASLHLPLGFGLSASYLLFHTRPLPLSGCQVPGVPTADVCTDGALVGPVVQNSWRHEQAFNASVDYDAGPLGVSLGLSTLRGLWASDGTAAQPFVFVNAYNYTTVSLSFSSSPEQIARALDKE